MDFLKPVEIITKNHETVINVLLGIIQAASTIILFIITISYARTTKRIAVLTREDFEATNRPFVFIEDFIILKEQGGCRLFLGNSGKFPAEVKIKSIKISCYTMHSNNGFDKSLTEIFGKGYFIFPDQKNGTIGIPFVGDVLDNILLSDGFILIIEFEYNQIGKINSKKWIVNSVVNYKTQRGTLEGKIHDLQTINSE